ncbi:hypothetical protein HC766_02395 [Candidatus Gracilibacteria bacterium]|nr:hypothetical protein [Candidatus Gracilibacteria bacterium]
MENKTQYIEDMFLAPDIDFVISKDGEVFVNDHPTGIMFSEVNQLEFPESSLFCIMHEFINQARVYIFEKQFELVA